MNTDEHTPIDPEDLPPRLRRQMELMNSGMPWWEVEALMGKESVEAYLIEQPGMLNRDKIQEVLSSVGSHARFVAFIQIAQRLRDEDYWFALRETYSSCDNLFRYKNRIKKAFKKEIAGRQELMTPEELAYLRDLPDMFTIYRGMTSEEFRSGEYGISWTTKREVAEYFANKYARNHDTNGFEKVVVSADVHKKDIEAIFLERKELEVITFKPVNVLVD